MNFARQQIQIDPVDGHSGTKCFGDASHPNERHPIEHSKALLNLLSARSAAEVCRHYAVDSMWDILPIRIWARNSPRLDSVIEPGRTVRWNAVTAWAQRRGKTSVRNHCSESAMNWAGSGSSTARSGDA